MCRTRRFPVLIGSETEARTKEEKVKIGEALVEAQSGKNGGVVALFARKKVPLCGEGKWERRKLEKSATRRDQREPY